MATPQKMRLGGQSKFSKTPFTVNRIGYGAMQLAGPGVWGPPADKKLAISILREAVERGVNHIDTSDFYGPHITNQLICETLHPYPNDLVIVTKVGAKRPLDKSWKRANSNEELTAAIHDNLQNLKLDSLQVVNFRFIGAGHGTEEASIAKQISHLADLKKQGLIRHLGLSNVTAKQIAEAQSITDIVCVQNNYNLAHRHDDSLIDSLAKQEIPYVPFFPLGGFSPLQSQTLTSVAERLKATSMQVALSWLLTRAKNILLIPGTSSLAHLRENLGSGEIELTAELKAELDGIAEAAVSLQH